MWFTGRLLRTGGLEARRKRPTDNQTLSVSPFTHQTRAAQGLLGTCEWQKGMFFNRAHTCLQHQQLCCLFSLFLTRETKHTSSWLLINPPPWVKPKKGRIFFTFYGLACHDPEETSIIFKSWSQCWTNNRSLIYQTKSDWTDKCLYFWLQLKHLTLASSLAMPNCTTKSDDSLPNVLAS